MRFLILLLLPFGLLFQQDSSAIKKPTCNIFEKNKKLIDTVVITGKVLQTEMLPHGSPDLIYLEKKKILPANHHYYAVKVKINNCADDLWLVCGDNSREARTAINDGAMKQITCIIFRDKKIPHSKYLPLVIVTKLRLIDNVLPN